jgi:ABC-type phosphate transport system substrate-binding protein
MEYGIKDLFTRRTLAVSCLVFACLASISLPGRAEPPASDSRSAIGPEFSNPDELATVPDGWRARPITHHPAYKNKADLVVALGQQTYPALNELVTQYARDNNLNIVLQQGTCGISAGRLLKKSVNIGAYCCPPGKNDRLPGLRFHLLGIAPIALIVHPDNPLRDITTQRAREIFRGRMNRWNQVDEEISQKLDRLVQPVGRLHCKVRPGHWRALLDNEDQFSPRLFEVGVIPDMISQVARNPGAIGWETPLMVGHHSKSGEVRMLNIDGHPPTDMEHVRSGRYPLYRAYHLTTWEDDDKSGRVAMALVEHLQNHLEKIHTQIGFIPPSQLREAGWKFRGDELIGEPDLSHTAKR